MVETHAQHRGGRRIVCRKVEDTRALIQYMHPGAYYQILTE